MKIFLVLIILALLSSQVLRLIPENKYLFLIKPAFMCAILLTVFSFASNINFKNTLKFEGFKANENEVWNEAMDNTQEIFEQQILNLCKTNGLNVTSVIVDLKTDYKNFDIERILVEGPDEKAAESLIISTYKLNKNLVK